MVSTLLFLLFWPLKILVFSRLPINKGFPVKFEILVRYVLVAVSTRDVYRSCYRISAVQSISRTS